MNISERFAKPTTARRILLIQLGDIGDVVWFLPALRAVREAFPGASVSVLLREGNGSLLAATVSPPMVFEVRKGVAGPGRWLASSLRLVRTLRRERFDLVFDFRGDERGGYMAFLTGAPVRAALYYSGLPWLRNRLFTHLVSPTGDFPSVGAADLSLYILRAFGIEAKDVAPELALSDKIILRASQLLVDEGFFLPKEAAGGGEEGGMAAGAVRRGGWVTVNPFSRWSYKEWAPEKWVKIIDWLWRDFGIVTVLVGSPEEGERAERLASSCTGKVHNLTGRSTLAELAGVLRLSRLQIGVDSAAPHLAAAVGTPTVTLYGPSDWRYWKPPGDRHRVVVPDMDCAPCHQKGCDGSGISRCLDTLEVGQMQAVIRVALSG